MNFNWLESYLFETDGVGFVLSMLPLVALSVLFWIIYIEKTGGGKGE